MTTKLKIFHLGLCVQPEPRNDMQNAFIRQCLEYAELSTGHPKVNEEAIRICKEFKPDVVFMQIQAPNIITRRTVLEMKQTGAYVINWTGDVRSPIPQWFKEVDADLSLFSNMPDVHGMRFAGFISEYLEIGYDPNIYCPEGEAKQIEPIVFFGNSYGNTMFPESEFRMKMVSYMKANFSSKFGVYGTGWVMASGNYNHSQREEASAYRGSKIAINASHFCIEKYSSDRLLRILGTGTAICLCKWYPGMDFVDGVHLRTWSTLEELKSLTEYYLDPANEQERLAITFNGMQKVRKEFTFDSMVKNIITLYEKHRG